MSQSAFRTHDREHDGGVSSVLSGAVPLIGRILLSAVFVVSGCESLASPGSTVGYIRSAGLPMPELGVAIQVLVEIVGGLALIAGYRTRLVAAALAAFCIAAAIAFHMNLADENQLWHFLKNLAMSGGLLHVVAFGGGRFSVDARYR